MHYKIITKGTLFYIKIYSALAEIIYDEIKPIIQIEIPGFYARKRIIGIAIILNELSTNYLSENSVWIYYTREQTMIYSNSRETRAADMEEIRQWILSLLKPEQQPTTRAIR
ncbi:hypothetical protein H5410_040782 [Solanum commersonii]|uniref:Uncharacterized protein n=1 Tax=Solanum commersonii TaxID=4109 RepID=A0A9J5XSI5_SOLCO|nr:hypothetical protein H5410_040782 [Solanum commersonii]